MFKKCKLPIMNSIILLLISSLMLSSFKSYPANASINPEVISIDSMPYNYTYNDWTAKWWQWALSIPMKSNPQNDPTGENCGINQHGPVWFLAGTTGGFVKRDCIIPSDKAILFPIINSECSFAESPNLKTPEDLRQCARSEIDTVTNLFTSIDKVELKDLKKYRITSPPFDINFPEDNIYGVSSGPTKGVSDGYWVFLNPLSHGEHEIYFKGSAGDYIATSSQNFVTETKYNMTVTN